MVQNRGENIGPGATEWKEYRSWCSKVRRILELVHQSGENIGAVASKWGRMLEMLHHIRENIHRCKPTPLVSEGVRD